MTTTTAAPPATPAVRRPRSAAPVWLAVLATSLPMFMATLDNLVMTTALPVVQADLGSSVGQLSWFLNAYTLAFASFMLPAAALGDRVGRRRMMLVGITVFTLGSIGAALSDSSGALVAARAVQGLGAAAVMPLSLTLLASSVSERMRPAAIGIWGGISGLGVALGPVIGGAVVEGISWEAIFWINVPVAAVAVPMMLWSVRESRGTWTRIDVAGAAMLGGAVLLGVWGTVHGNDDGWTSLGVLVPLVLAGLLLPAYVAHAARTPHAVLPLRLFRHRSFSAANAIGLFFTLGMFGAVFLLSQYLQVVQGFSPLQAGLRTLPWTAAPMVVAPLAGLVASRVGLRSLLVVGLGLLGGSLLWLAGLTESTAAYSSYVPALLMAGVGTGLIFSPVAAATLEGLPERDFAIASSSNSTIREFGVALGIAVLTAVFTGHGGQLVPTGYAGAIGPALATGAIAVGVALVAAFFVPGRRH